MSDPPRRPPPRRIVAAKDAEGRSIYTEDGEAPTLFESERYRVWAIWGSDERPRLGESAPPWERRFDPPPEGVRVTVSDILPGTREEIAGGMHETATLDFVFVLSGTVHLIEGGGEELALRAGDSLVQAGSVHSWHNPGPKLARIAVVLLGAKPARD